jgi:hypothetical protein
MAFKRSSSKITIGNYEQNTLLESCKRLATLIYTQELYYPRPSQAQVYSDFKDGHLKEVGQVLDVIAKTVSDPGEVFEELKEEVLVAARGFFEEYEQKDAARLASRSRLRRGGA